MQTQNPFLDDLARMAGGALGALSGVKAEIEALVRQQMERFLAGMDLVTRAEFDVVRDMAQKAREENEDLASRLAALEARLNGPAGGDAVPAAAEAGADGDLGGADAG